MDELSKRYRVPWEVGKQWVDADQILPLLDGLDEVKVEYRAVCAETIRLFRQGHGLLPLVICSREADYEALEKNLELQDTIVVQPLTREQVDLYLRREGEHLAAVRQALYDDPTLWELLDTPLMLNIVTLAYDGQPIKIQQHDATKEDAQKERQRILEERRSHVFAAYVDRMFKRRSVVSRYTTEQTIRWLTWLAKQMKQHSQTELYIESLRQDWFPTQRQQSLIRVGASIGGLLSGLVFGLLGWLLRGLDGGLVFGLIVRLFSGWFSRIGNSG